VKRGQRMRFPRILIGAALVAAGLFLPSAITAPERAPAGTVGMEHEKFTGPQTVTIPRWVDRLLQRLHLAARHRSG
jgi:hypothetical protein